MKHDFSDRNVLVSGSTKGIGREIAVKLAEHGANVVVNGRSEPPGHELVERLESGHEVDAHFVQADINTYEGAETLVTGAIEALGQIDTVVVSGGARSGPKANFFRDQPPEDILEFCVNQYANRLYVAKAVLEHLIEIGGGRIVNLSTDAGRVPTPGEVAPGGAAAALQLSTRTMAKEFSRWNITVNTVAVSVVQDQIDLEKVGDESVSAMFEEIIDRQTFPLESPDVASIVAYLAGSEATAPITGQTLHVTGGVSY